MIKRVIAMLLCIGLCVSFASCSSSNTQAEPTTTKPPKPNVLMVEDIINHEGVYCLHANGSVTRANKLTHIKEDDWIFTGGSPLVIDRANGDLLIYVGDLVYLSAGNGEQFEMDFYAEQFYWSGEEVDLMAIEEFEGVALDGEVKESGIYYWMNVDDFFEPFGITFQGTESYSFAEYGYFLSKEPVTYSYGFYEGTKWVGTDAVNDLLFYDATLHDFKKGYAFRSDVIKGKNGYFTIDLEGIEAGLYVNEFQGNGHIYAIDIK